MKLYINFWALFILILMNKPTWSQAFTNRSVSLAANHNFATNGFNASYHWEINTGNSQQVYFLS